MIGDDARLVLRKGAAIFRSWKTRDGGTGVQYSTACSGPATGCKAGAGRCGYHRADRTSDGPQAGEPKRCEPFLAFAGAGVPGCCGLRTASRSHQPPGRSASVAQFRRAAAQLRRASPHQQQRRGARGRDADEAGVAGERALPRRARRRVVYMVDERLRAGMPESRTGAGTATSTRPRSASRSTTTAGSRTPSSRSPRCSPCWRISRRAEHSGREFPRAWRCRAGTQGRSRR